MEAGGHFLEEPRPARILRVEGDSTVEVVTLGALTPVRAPVVGIQWHNGAFYITHRAEDRTGAVSRVTMDGRVELLFKGILDSAAEHMLGSIRVGPDGRMYFTAGPAGNSAVMGQDEARFVQRTPNVHTTPCQDIVLTGRNFKMANYLSNAKGDSVLTGAYVPFNTETRPGQVIPGVKKCGGSILTFDPNSSNPEQTIRTMPGVSATSLTWPGTSGASCTWRKTATTSAATPPGRSRTRSTPPSRSARGSGTATRTSPAHCCLSRCPGSSRRTRCRTWCTSTDNRSGRRWPS